MDLQEKITIIHQTKEMVNSEINSLWQQAIIGESDAFLLLKFYYMKQLVRIRPLYDNLNEESFYNLVEQAVTKALERGLKFQISDFEAYMTMASNTYFKHLFTPNSHSLLLPTELMLAFSKLDEVYTSIPTLASKSENEQINLLSFGFEYPIFSTRLLYFSFIKWKNNSLRQVDIDLTVNLLPAPQRVEWEIFYEKDINDIVNSITEKLGE